MFLMVIILSVTPLFFRGKHGYAFKMRGGRKEIQQKAFGDPVSGFFQLPQIAEQRIRGTRNIQDPLRPASGDQLQCGRIQSSPRRIGQQQGTGRQPLRISFPEVLSLPKTR